MTTALNKMTTALNKIVNTNYISMRGAQSGPTYFKSLTHLHGAEDVFRDYNVVMFGITGDDYKSIPVSESRPSGKQISLSRRVQIRKDIVYDGITDALMDMYSAETRVDPRVVQPIQSSLQSTDVSVIVLEYLGGEPLYTVAEDNFIKSVQPQKDGLLLGRSYRTICPPWLLVPLFTSTSTGKIRRRKTQKRRSVQKLPGSASYLFKTMQETGIRCMAGEFIGLVRAFIIAHGTRGLACLAAMGPPPTKLVDRAPVESRFLLEGMTLGLEALNIVDTRCMRNSMCCSCYIHNCSDDDSEEDDSEEDSDEVKVEQVDDDDVIVLSVKLGKRTRED